MIKKYNLEEFLDKFYNIISIDDYTIYNIALTNESLEDFVESMNNIIFEVHKYLNEDVILFWEKLIDIVKHEKQVEKLFMSSIRNDFLHNNKWTDEENFSKLKYNLSSCEINFIDSNVNNVCKKINERFDVIYLTNIIDRIYYDKRSQETVELLSYLAQVLNNDGVIYDYAWRDLSFILEDKTIAKQYKVDSLIIEADAAYVYKFKKRKKLFRK